MLGRQVVGLRQDAEAQLEVSRQDPGMSGRGGCSTESSSPLVRCREGLVFFGEHPKTVRGGGEPSLHVKGSPRLYARALVRLAGRGGISFWR